MAKKKLSAKGQKMLESMMVQVRKDLPQLHSITVKLKNLNTPEGRLNLANHIQKQKSKEEPKTAPFFKRETM